MIIVYDHNGTFQAAYNNVAMEEVSYSLPENWKITDGDMGEVARLYSEQTEAYSYRDKKVKDLKDNPKNVLSDDDRFSVVTQSLPVKTEESEKSVSVKKEK